MFLVLVAAASLTCPSPLPPDGASLACGGGRRIRLAGIAVPPPLDSCKSWDVLCEPDRGTLARDHLADLTRGRQVTCTPQPGGAYACQVGGRDLACAMITDGLARPVGPPRKCPPPPPTSPLLSEGLLPPLWAVAVFLILLNIAGAATVLFGEYRHRRGFGAMSDRLPVLLTLFGGGAGVVAAQMGIRRQDAGVSAPVAIVLGLQIGAALGLLFL